MFLGGHYRRTSGLSWPTCFFPPSVPCLSINYSCLPKAGQSFWLDSVRLSPGDPRPSPRAADQFNDWKICVVQSIRYVPIIGHYQQSNVQLIFLRLDSIHHVPFQVCNIFLHPKPTRKPFIRQPESEKGGGPFLEGPKIFFNSSELFVSTECLPFYLAENLSTPRLSA